MHAERTQSPLVAQGDRYRWRSRRDPRPSAHLAAAAERLNIEAARVAPFQFTVSDAGFDVKLAAHHAGRDAIKARRPELMVGWTLANTDIHAAPGGEANADRIRREVNERFLEASRRDDFVGIQTYGRTVFGAEGLVHAEDGVPHQPDGRRNLSGRLEATIREAARIAQIPPVIVTENGLATEDDTQRLDYLRTAVAGVASCLADGIDVRAISPGPRSITSSGCSDTFPSSA